MSGIGKWAEGPETPEGRAARDAWDASRGQTHTRLYHVIRRGRIGRWYRHHKRFGLNGGALSIGDAVGWISWFTCLLTLIAFTLGLMFSILWLAWTAVALGILAMGLWLLSISID